MLNSWPDWHCPWPDLHATVVHTPAVRVHLVERAPPARGRVHGSSAVALPLTASVAAAQPSINDLGCLSMSGRH